MEEINLQKFFYFFSKLILILPLIIIILGLLMKLNQVKTGASKNKTGGLSVTVIPSPLVKKLSGFNLKESIICQFSKKNYGISLLLKNKLIFAEIVKDKEIENLLLKDDCYYKWIKGQFSGEKKCGLGTLVSIAETMMSINPNASIEDFIGMIPDAILNKTVLSKEEIKNFADSCIKQEISNKIFDIPQNILFKNSQ